MPYNYYGSTTLSETKRRRSDPVLWQKPLYQQKCQRGKVATQTTPQKSSIKQQLRTDLGRSVENSFCLSKCQISNLSTSFIDAVRLAKISFPAPMGKRVNDNEFCDSQQVTSSFWKWKTRWSSVSMDRITICIHYFLKSNYVHTSSRKSRKIKPVKLLKKGTQRYNGQLYNFTQWFYRHNGKRDIKPC